MSNADRSDFTHLSEIHILHQYKFTELSKFTVFVKDRVLSWLYYFENGNENENITKNITGR